MTARDTISRRRFLGGAAGAALGAISFPYVVPSSVLGGDAPSDRITLGFIGDPDASKLLWRPYRSPWHV